MNLSVRTASGINLSICHHRQNRKKTIVLAPGFFQSKETQTFKRLSSDLEKSFDVISMDFRGHGKSEGLYTFSALEKEDLKTVLDYARNEYEKVGVLGFSYGGSIAILEQAEYKNIDSLICVASPMAADQIEFQWWKIESMKLGMRGLERGAGVKPGNPFLPKIRPLDVVAAVSPTPIYFLHGSVDPTVGVKHSQMLFDAAKHPKKLKIIDKASHAEDIYRQMPEIFVPEITGWFLETL
jgi:pimeloyl-ACP methyl ester carboxylesterase